MNSRVRPTPPPQALNIHNRMGRTKRTVSSESAGKDRHIHVTIANIKRGFSGAVAATRSKAMPVATVKEAVKSRAICEMGCGHRRE